MIGQPIRVRLAGNIVLVYDLPSHEWSVERAPPGGEEDAEAKAGRANEMTLAWIAEGGNYAPWRGRPGAEIVSKVAEDLGGRAVFPPEPPERPGVIY